MYLYVAHYYIGAFACMLSATFIFWWDPQQLMVDISWNDKIAAAAVLSLVFAPIAGMFFRQRLEKAKLERRL